ncbi:MAG TPA: hypothetical protein PLV85_21640, partial [Polyangiaceae bacterium]|nr:hypothetical protein [Polyangiaceae bacterium]
MDVVTNAKVAFVLERYALDDVSEICLRTRAMATALAERGHDVTVLTTCSRYPGQWNNDVAEGESTIDSLSVVRFRLEQRLVHRLDRPAKWLASYNTLAAKVWGHSVGPVCPGYRPYLDQFGPLFDAVFFTGAWGYLVSEGMGRVRNAVLCPAPWEDRTHQGKQAATLLRQARGVALASSAEEKRLRTATEYPWSCPTFVIGAAPDPLPSPSYRSKRLTLVDGPFLLAFGHYSPAADRLLEAFQLFRQAHGDTSFEDDRSERMSAKNVRLVLAGDDRFPHDPGNGVVSLGPVDDTARESLMRHALAVVHADPCIRLSTGLLSAWMQGCPTLIHAGSTDLQPVLDAIGKECVF